MVYSAIPRTFDQAPHSVTRCPSLGQTWQAAAVLFP
jgi:hypothetical protein